MLLVFFLFFTELTECLQTTSPCVKNLFTLRHDFFCCCFYPLDLVQTVRSVSSESPLADSLTHSRSFGVLG